MLILNHLFGCSKWVSAREKFQQAANLIDAEPRMKKSMWGQFWSAHQRFFKYLCIASKVHRVVQLAREEVKLGKVGAEQRAAYSGKLLYSHFFHLSENGDYFKKFSLYFCYSCIIYTVSFSSPFLLTQGTLLFSVFCPTLVLLLKCDCHVKVNIIIFSKLTII